MSAKHAELAIVNGRRLQSTIRRVEQQPYDFTPDRRPPRPGGSGFRIGKTTTSFSLRDVATPGAGQVTLQDYRDGTLHDTDRTVTAYLFSASATIDAGKYVLVAKVGAEWWVVSAEC